MSSSKHEHLKMIQNVVDRLASNSFSLKGWSVVLISAMFALASSDDHQFFLYLAYFPAVIFWGLDGYFLHQERLFRRLYDHVRTLKEGNIDFSMNISKVKKKGDTWFSATFSKTLIAFHGSILVSIIIITVISFNIA